MPEQGPPADAGLLGLGQGVDQGTALGRGPRLQPGDAGVADTPLGDVDDPPQGHLVGGVDHRPQVGEGVLHLPPLVEAGAAHHLVGDVEPHQVLLQHPALGVGAVEDGHVGPPPLLRPVQPQHLPARPRGLVGLVLGEVALDQLAADLLGPQRLGLALEVVGDHRVGRVEDGLGRPVVLLEHDHGGVGERVLELEDVPDVGASKLVDAVVHEHAVGHVGVGGLDLEVVDGTVVVLDVDRVDPGRRQGAVALDEHGHAHP